MTYPYDEWVGDHVLEQRTGLSRSFWRKSRVSGLTPPYAKISSAVRYRWGDVVEWLEARSRRSTSEASE